MVIRHLDQTDLAERWNISARTLERWRWIGEGPCYVKLGGRVRYRIEDVEAFESRQLRDSTAAPADTAYSRSVGTDKGNSVRAGATPAARPSHGHDAVS